MEEFQPLDVAITADPAIVLPAPRRRWLAIVLASFAWLVIGVLVFGAAFSRFLQQESDRAEADVHPSGAALVVMQMQARYIVGGCDVMSAIGQDTKDLREQAKQLNVGSYEQRLRYIAVAGELFGPEEALERLAELKKWRLLGNPAIPPAGADPASEVTLEKLYRDDCDGKNDRPDVPESERARLIEKLGWFGELALAPREVDHDGEARNQALTPARRTFFALVGGILLVALYGAAGLLGLAIIGLLILAKVLPFGLTTGHTQAGVYAETFACWLLLFLALSAGAHALTVYLPQLGPFRLVLAGMGMLLSLAALVWPLLRGLSWRQVREDIGLTGGRRGASLEAGLGFLCYAMALPILVVGLAMTLTLIQLQNSAVAEGAGGGPGNEAAHGTEVTHPIVEEIARGDRSTLIIVFLLACVVAPIVEETMFRGVLYRHLREISAWLGLAVSVALSGLWVAFIFAVIHPQGLLAVPVLMSLAFAFALAREWRGTLLPAMVAHGLNNGAVMLIVSLAVGG